MFFFFTEFWDIAFQWSLSDFSLSLIRTVPCPPQRVKSDLLCSSNSVHVEWNLGTGAESFEVHAISTDGQSSGCDTTNTSCVVPNLVCGSIYNISVLAIGHHCNVSKSAITTLHSGRWPLIKHNTMHLNVFLIKVTASSTAIVLWPKYQFPFFPQCHVFPTRFRQTWAVHLVWLMCPGSLAEELSLTLLSLRAAGALLHHATAPTPHVSSLIYCVDSHTASACLPPMTGVPAHRVKA